MQKKPLTKFNIHLRKHVLCIVKLYFTCTVVEAKTAHLVNCYPIQKVSRMVPLLCQQHILSKNCQLCDLMTCLSPKLGLCSQGLSHLI